MMTMMMIVWTTNSYCSAINGGIAATNTRVTIAFVSSNVFVCSFLLYHSSLIGHNILNTYLWMFSFDVHFHQFTPSHELSICLSTSFQSIWECVLTKLPTHSIFFFLLFDRCEICSPSIGFHLLLSSFYRSIIFFPMIVCEQLLDLFVCYC